MADACQPLHISKFSNGRDESEDGVHEAYETKMVEKRISEMISGLDRELEDGATEECVTSDEAPATIAGLMSDTFEQLAPERICEVFAATGGDAARMWDELGPATIKCVAAGCRTLAMLWTSAFAQAGAAPPPPEAADRAALRALYEDRTFAPSLYLTEMVPAPAAVA